MKLHLSNALLLPLALFLSINAFAWKGTGARPEADPKIPFDTDNAKKAETLTGDLIIEGGYSNQKGKKDLVCDVVGKLDGSRGGDLVTVTTYVDKRVVRAFRSFKDKFLFTTAEAGPGYRWLKKSQAYHASCLELDVDETPDQVPSPHEKCDPEWEDCDWTCKAGANPDQCEDPEQDWTA